jgi:hypothetical protein
MKRSSVFRTVTVGVSVFALMVICLPVVEADPLVVEVERAAALIAEVAPERGAVVGPDITRTGIVAETGDVVVAIPVSPDDTIVLESSAADGSALLEMALPEELDVREARVADNGTVVYVDAKGGADAAVQVLDDGSVRVQTITHDQSGPTGFTYGFGEDVIPFLREDGGADLGFENEYLRAIIGSVEPAWAVDAQGEPVETFYTVERGRLVQTIIPVESTVYPIVADPTISGNLLRVTIYFNKAETRKIASRGFSATVWTLGLAPIATYGAPVAGIIVSLVTAQLGLASLMAGQAVNNGICVYTSVRLAPPVSYSFPYSGGNCR